jgi:hypothetical protein
MTLPGSGSPLATPSENSPAAAAAGAEARAGSVGSAAAPAVTAMPVSS